MVDKREYLQNLKMVDLRHIAKINNVIGISQYRKNQLVDLMVDCDLGKLEEQFDVPTKPIEQEIFEYSMKAAAAEVACCHGSDDPLCKECEEPIILHLPIKPEKSASWEKAYNKGLQILQKK